MTTYVQMKCRLRDGRSGPSPPDERRASIVSPTALYFERGRRPAVGLDCPCSLPPYSDTGPAGRL